jgi:hypothetical protein
MRACAKENLRETSVLFQIIFSFSENDNTNDSLTMSESLTFFQYICQFDNCNNQETENEVLKAINNQNIDLSSIHQAFITRLQEKQTTKPNSGSSSTRSETPSISTSTFQQTTTKQPPNTSILHFISMNILILHILFLIFF